MAEKKRTELDWQDLRVFLALGRHGSLSAAARTLNVNHATISRRIQSLEAHFEKKLVERRPDGYVLTPDGTHVLSAASIMELAVQTIERGGSESSMHGLVRVNVSPAVAQGFLIRRLSELSRKYPGIDIDLASELRSVSLERHETDIAIRFGPPQDGHHMAKPLLTIGYGFYGTPEACERVEAGGEPVFIGFDERHAYIQEAVWLSEHFPQARTVFRANNQAAQAIAARSGTGVAILPHYIGRTDPELRLCNLEPVPPGREVWLLTRRADRNSLPIRTVAEHIQWIFAQEQALFE